jgi:hypothetical protein
MEAKIAEKLAHLRRLDAMAAKAGCEGKPVTATKNDGASSK